MAIKINKRVFSIVGSIVLGVALLIIVLLKYPFKDVALTFSNVTPTLLIAYLCVSFSIMLLFAIRWRYVLKTLGYNVPFLDVFGFRVIEYGISYITPSGKAGGEPVRAALLMKRGIGFKEGLSTVFADKTIELSVSLLFFIFGILTLALGYALPVGLNVILILLSMALLFLIWKFYSRILRGKTVFVALYKFLRLDKVKFMAKYQQAIVDFEKPIIKFYTKERKAFFIALGLSVLSLCLSLVEYKLVLLMLGIDAPLSVIFMVLSVVGIAFLVPVPMGLGSLEAFQAALFSVLGIGSASGIGLAVITRARDLLWVLVAVVLSLYLGSFRSLVKEAFNSKNSNPIMKATVFRDGEEKHISIPIHRADWNKASFIAIQKLKYRYDFFKMPGSGHNQANQLSGRSKPGTKKSGGFGSADPKAASIKKGALPRRNLR
ncbi:MAG: lysylphosphatidylglycerol synthase transmembrane domain-containing protein [archaeon]